MANTAKQSQVDKITSFLGEFPNFTLFKFEKTSHVSMENLRKQLRKSGAKVMVIKNSLLQKAVNQMAEAKDGASLKGIQKTTKSMTEKTAILGFGQDWGAGMSTFSAFSKEDKSVSFKAGRLDGVTYAQAELVRIAGLPPKAELMAKVLGGMKSPMAHFANALRFNMQKFVYVLNAKAKAG